MQTPNSPKRCPKFILMDILVVLVSVGVFFWTIKDKVAQSQLTTVEELKYHLQKSGNIQVQK